MRARYDCMQRLISICLIINGLIGAGAPLMATTAMAEPLKIGFVATFSGPGGVLGTELYDGFMLGVEHANGRLGGLDTEVLQVDDQLIPDTGKQADRK